MSGVLNKGPMGTVIVHGEALSIADRSAFNLPGIPGETYVFLKRDELVSALAQLLAETITHVQRERYD